MDFICVAVRGGVVVMGSLFLLPPPFSSPHTAHNNQNTIHQQEPSGRLFIECYQVCQRRADLWQQQPGGG